LADEHEGNPGMSDALERVRGQWETAAPGWAKWDEKFSSNMGRVTELLLDRAGVSHGGRVIDLACGAGAMAFAAAQRVGPTGTAIASDIAQGMLDHVAREAGTLGVKNIEVLLGAAETLEVPERSLDAAVCRFGLMLFPDPDAAMTGLRRALRPGAGVAAAVFTRPQGNALFSSALSILMRHGGKQPPPPGQPGLYALGAPGLLEGVMIRSGYVDYGQEILNVPLKFGPPIEVLTMIQEAYGAYRAMIADRTPEEQEAAWAEVLASIETHDAGDGVRSNAEVLIGWARTPD
jgi:SAM-dependent methyltransferase